LDGELWAGHGTLTVAANAAIHGLWDERLRFMCFDVPGVGGDWLVGLTFAFARSTLPWNGGFIA
jgi:hypothetical protein